MEYWKQVSQEVDKEGLHFHSIGNRYIW